VVCNNGAMTNHNDKPTTTLASDLLEVLLALTGNPPFPDGPNGFGGWDMDLPDGSVLRVCHEDAECNSVDVFVLVNGFADQQAELRNLPVEVVAAMLHTLVEMSEVAA
jgi:hypothetical protein